MKSKDKNEKGAGSTIFFYSNLIKNENNALNAVTIFSGFADATSLKALVSRKNKPQVASFFEVTVLRITHNLALPGNPYLYHAFEKG